MTKDPTEWVTVREAAQRLNVAPRQARRWADRLGPEDRDKDSVPVLVRLSAIQAQ